MNNNDPKVDYEFRQVYLRTIDLLSLLHEQLGATFHSLGNVPSFYQLIMPALCHSSLETRQFVLSLLGEMAPQLSHQASLNILYQQLMPQVYPNIYYPGGPMDPGNCYLTLCNNALFCLGEIAMACPALLMPQIQSTQQQVIAHFTSHKKLQKLFAQNVAKTIGRLALLDKSVVTGSLATFLKQWSLSIKSCSDSLSKRQSVQGIFSVLLDLPATAQDFYEYVLYVFTSLESNNPQFPCIQ